jgi:hypothetical protein
VREQAEIGPRALKPPNSVEFAWQTVSWLKDHFRYKSVSDERWQEALDEAERYRIYERVPPEKPYGSLDALLRAEIGLGVVESQIAVRARAAALAGNPQVTESNEHGGDHTTEEGKATLLYKVAQYGTSQEYLIRRLKRDAPDIAEALGRGEYPSARAAAKAAGIIKTLSPFDLLKREWEKASEDERRRFDEWRDAQSRS